MANFNDDWGKFIKGLQTTLGGGQENAQLQILSTPIPFNWGITTGNKNPLEYWNFCNQLPKWSEVGEYIPLAGSLVDGFESFLNNMKQDYSQALKNQITQKEETLAADQATLNTALTSQGAQYKQYADNQAQLGLPADDFDTWSTKTGADIQLKSLLDRVQKDHDIIVSLYAQQNREYADAWGAFNNEDYKGFYTDASNNLQNKRIYEWSENPVDMTQKLRAGTLANSKTIEWSNKSANYDFSKSWAKGRGGIGGVINYVFWGIGASGEWTQMNTSDVKNSFSASISFKDLSLITVNPDTGWFNDGYLKTKADGPYVDDNTVGFGNEATGNQTYFFDGEKAILPGQITGILVGYQPKFKITTSASSFDDVYKSAKGSGGVKIGPFHFGPSGGHTCEISKSTSEANTLVGEDTSDVPQIFGVFLKVLPA
jgi:hypothetical protein